jgi:hypothetical protein
MKKQLALLIASAALLASSCKVVGTLYPISRNEKDFIFKKELIGKWGDSRDSSGYYSVDTVSGKNGKLYQIKTVFTNNEKNTADTNRFRAILVMISGWYYLDCWFDLENEFNNIDKNYEDWLIARHFIFRLSFPGTDKLEMVAPDGDELIKLIDQKKIIANYANLKKDDYLILDKPAILQRAFAESKKYPLLYKDKNVLHKLE